MCQWSVPRLTPINLIPALGEEAVGKGFVFIKLGAGRGRDYELISKYIIPGKHHEENKERGMCFCYWDSQGFYFTFYYYFCLRGFAPKVNKETGVTESYRRIFIGGSNNLCKDQGLTGLEVCEGLKGPCDWGRTVRDEVRKGSGVRSHSTRPRKCILLCWSGKWLETAEMGEPAREREMLLSWTTELVNWTGWKEGIKTDPRSSSPIHWLVVPFT